MQIQSIYFPGTHTLFLLARLKKLVTALVLVAAAQQAMSDGTQDIARQGQADMLTIRKLAVTVLQPQMKQ